MLKLNKLLMCLIMIPKIIMLFQNNGDMIRVSKSRKHLQMKNLFNQKSFQDSLDDAFFLAFSFLSISSCWM